MIKLNYRLLLLCIWVLTFFGSGCAGEQQLFGEESLEKMMDRHSRPVEELLRTAGISTSKPFRLVLVAFKDEKRLEVWARQHDMKNMVKLKDYTICRSSGSPGPKRKAGDKQVPEGFYRITHLNPNSSYHLSMGINYPNASDRILSDPVRPGSDIFIHGKCVTIGCIPLGDEAIEELYLLCDLAMKGDSLPVQVYIFPMDFSKASREMYREYPGLVPFWENLKAGYDLFYSEKRPLEISVDKAGNYRFR